MDQIAGGVVDVGGDVIEPFDCLLRVNAYSSWAVLLPRKITKALKSYTY